MSIFRNNVTRFLATLLLPILMLSPSTGYAQDKQKEKANKPAENRNIVRPESSKSSPRDDNRGPERTFIPREKISAGKPVSFPTDI